MSFCVLKEMGDMYMSQKNMKKFLLRLEQDEEVKSKFNKIMAFSDSKIGIFDKSDHMVENEVISLASTVGITLAMDDLIKNPIEQALADDQLNEVVGGRGEFTFRFDRYICDFCPNNETF